MTIQERKIMQYPQIKKRMVELVKILKKKHTREKKLVDSTCKKKISQIN
jgi:hypothetical protein